MKYSLLSILLFFVTSLYATHYSYTDGVVENGDFEVSREVKQGSNYIDVTYRFGGFSVEKTTIDNQEFHTISINSVPVIGEKGDPELPTITDLLSVASSNVKVEVVNQTFKEYKTFYIAPSKGAICQSETGESDSLVFSDVYNKNAYFPESGAKILAVQSYRSYPFASVKLNPILFNPVTKTIKCYTEITYRLSWNKSDFHSEAAITGDENLPLNYKRMPSLLRGVVADYVPSNDATESASLRAGNATLSKEHADYLIVTTNKFLPAVEKFKKWKSKLGYKCKVISKDDWAYSPNDVRQAIRAAYTANEKPEYLLIVGDIDDVPAYLEDYTGELSSPNMGSYASSYQSKYGSWATDLKYVCMDGADDYTADMARGRIPVSTLDQANVVFNKIIKYEQNPVLDDDFYNTGTHCAYFQDYYIKNNKMYPDNGIEDRRFVLTSEEIRNYMMGWHKNINRVYTAEDWGAQGYGTEYEPHYYSNLARYSNGAKLPSDLYGYGQIWKGTTSDVAGFINKGSFYVLHRDHGSYNGWGDPKFYISDVEELTNGDKTPVVFSLNCLTGGFQKNCFCEAFLQNPKGGAVGIFGATALSISGPNDGFAIGMFDAMFPNPGVTTTWANGRTYKPSNLEPVYNMGHVMNKGLLMMPQIYANDIKEIKYTNHIFHWFGDPSMELRTEVPACLDAIVTKTGTTVKVTTPVTGCRISLCSTDDAGDTYVQSFDGVSEASFEGIDFNYAVTVYKHNYVPFVYDGSSSAVNCFVNNSDAVTYIQNKTYSANEDVKANTIVAGNSVTRQTTAGDVLVNNVNVNYYATEYIEFKSGFTVSNDKSSGIFVAKTGGTSCSFSKDAPFSSYSAVETEAPEYNESNNSNDVDIKEVNDPLTGNNNLSSIDIKTYVKNGEIFVVLGDLNANVIISDVSGKQIASKQGNNTLRFSVNKGAYVVTVQLANGNFSEKIVVD